MLLAALERAWRAIGEHHPDLPPAQIVIGQGSGQRGLLLLGHLAPDRWQPTDGRGALRHELLIAGEGLARGAIDVFTTALHEAVHALALARGIADTSRDGRYHNKRYRHLAQEVGLEVERDTRTGWSETTLPPATQARYQPAIDELGRAITLHRLREPAAPRGRKVPAAVCGCPRRIRVAPSVLEAGEITCAICHQPFTTPPPEDEDPEGGTPDPAAQRSARRARRGRDRGRGRVNARAVRGVAGPAHGRSLHVGQPIPNPAGGGHSTSPEELAGSPRRPFDSRSALCHG
ncbi:MAG: hypothetical protein QOI65_1635, partial [Thermoleophilaceae bacterium]|nr:hypothetical protein [Thermoleophilaceae bacterium]